MITFELTMGGNGMIVYVWTFFFSWRGLNGQVCLDMYIRELVWCFSSMHYLVTYIYACKWVYKAHKGESTCSFFFPKDALKAGWPIHVQHWAYEYTGKSHYLPVHTREHEEHSGGATSENSMYNTFFFKTSWTRFFFVLKWSLPAIHFHFWVNAPSTVEQCLAEIKSKTGQRFACSL